MTKIRNSKRKQKFLTKIFYILIGIVSSLVFFLLLYWSLSVNSSITSFIQNTKSEPVYLLLYAILTIIAVVLFGINVPLLVYRWRKFGPPKLKSQGGTGIGSLVGVAASACPVCGSTLLAAIGIAGGLAAFPLGGLELKGLSAGLLMVPLFLITRDIKKNEAECKRGSCPLPRDHSFKDVDRPWLLGLFAITITLALISWRMLLAEPIVAKALSRNSIINPKDNKLYSANISETGNELIDKVTEKVLPEKGFQSKIVLGDSVLKLLQGGVIDKEKFLAIYRDREGLPEELNTVLDKASYDQIILTRENANYYVNLLWPLGLSNYMSSNKESPIRGKSLFNFASTGGWNLGKEENGGAYFNKLKIVELTPEQEALVTKIAQNAYRPCCNNSTFFQDCNHGSALLGFLQLGASQGLSEDELFKEALAFNSFWFPHNYIQTGLYFKAVENTDWENVNPKLAMGKDFSSIGGWYENVDKEVKRLGLVPERQGGGSCGV